MLKEKIKVLIVEDEFITLDTLRDELEEIGYEVVGDAMRADEALAILDREDVDIAILDIHLKGSESGIWLAHRINESYKIPFIFLTAFSDRKTVKEAAGTDPAGYLVKPFTQADLYTSIELALINHAKNAEVIQLPTSHTDHTDDLLIRESIYVKGDRTFKKLRLHEILYVEAFKNYLELYLDEDRHVIRSTLKDFISVLPSDDFVQTHRSYVVNLKHVEEVGGNFLKVRKNTIPVSRSQKEEVMNRLKLYL